MRFALHFHFVTVGPRICCQSPRGPHRRGGPARSAGVLVGDHPGHLQPPRAAQRHSREIVDGGPQSWRAISRAPTPWPGRRDVSRSGKDSKSPCAAPGTRSLRPASATSKTSFCRGAHRIDRGEHGGQVAVVEAAGVELAFEIVEHGQPRQPARRDRHLAFDDNRDLDAALDDVDGAPSRSCCSGLLPRSMPAGWRTPLRHPACAAGPEDVAAPRALEQLRPRGQRGPRAGRAAAGSAP
jgi:hypothetical protein